MKLEENVVTLKLTPICETTAEDSRRCHYLGSTFHVLHHDLGHSTKKGLSWPEILHITLPIKWHYGKIKHMYLFPYLVFAPKGGCHLVKEIDNMQGEIITEQSSISDP